MILCDRLCYQTDVKTGHIYLVDIVWYDGHHYTDHDAMGEQVVRLH